MGGEGEFSVPDFGRYYYFFLPLILIVNFLYLLRMAKIKKGGGEGEFSIPDFEYSF